MTIMQLKIVYLLLMVQSIYRVSIIKEMLLLVLKLTLFKSSSPAMSLHVTEQLLGGLRWSILEVGIMMACTL